MSNGGAGALSPSDRVLAGSADLVSYKFSPHPEMDDLLLILSLPWIMCHTHVSAWQSTTVKSISSQVNIWVTKHLYSIGRILFARRGKVPPHFDSFFLRGHTESIKIIS